MSEFIRKAPRSVALFTAAALGAGALMIGCGGSSEKNDGMVDVHPTMGAAKDTRCATVGTWDRPRKFGQDPPKIAEKLHVPAQSVEVGSFGAADCRVLIPPSVWKEETAVPLTVLDVPYPDGQTVHEVTCLPVDTVLELDVKNRDTLPINVLLFVCPDPRVQSSANPLPSGANGPVA